jgi:hypothetical protein
MMGITQGRGYFVKPRTGQTGARGTSPEHGLKTILAAYNKCVTGRNDVVRLMAEGNTASETTDYQLASLVWAKNQTHLIGDLPIAFSSRSRIATQTVSISPLLDITGSGCVFANISVYHGVTADQLGLLCVRVSGERNYFKNCHFAGGGIATTADDAGMRSLQLVGGGENVFEDCVIGIDTMDRAGTANAELEFLTSTARNIFRRCYFVTNGSVAHAHVIVAATGIASFAIFDNCVFINSGGTALTEVFSCTAGDGHLICKDCLAWNSGPWEADVETARVVIAPNSTDQGLAGAPESP